MRRIIAIIPARSGSKGLPHKNVRKIGGKTLIEWAVHIGVESSVVADTYISTDSEEYEKIALAAGAKSLGLRPENLSTDTAKSYEAVLDVLEKLASEGQVYDAVLLLQPTAPQRTIEEVERLVAVYENEKAAAVISVCRFEEPHPYKLKKIAADGQLLPFMEDASSETARQSMEPAYRLTGAYYLIDTKILADQKTFFPQNSYPFVTDSIINIDTAEDLEYLEYLLEKGKARLPDMRGA